MALVGAVGVTTRQLAAATATPSATTPTPHLSASERLARVTARAAYRAALADLSAGRLEAFEQRKTQLGDYLLAPYLDYHAARRRIDRMSAAELQALQLQYAHLPFADRLRDEWLLRLPLAGRWDDYLHNYVPSSSPTRRCYYLRALYRSGERQAALTQVEELWVVGKSQPKACDPLFKVWQEAGFRTNSMIWQRLQLALARNQVALARYLLRQFSAAAPQLQHAQALYRAHRSPATELTRHRQRGDKAAERAVVMHAVKRLALSDPAAAWGHWQVLREAYTFELAQRTVVEHKLLLAGASTNLFPPPEQRPAQVSGDTLEWLARYAVRHSNWSEAVHWIERMPATMAAAAQWRYWQAYSRSQVAPATGPVTLATGGPELARQRHYYGFLAARDLGLDSHLNHVPSLVSEQLVRDVAALPGIDRALELHALDDLLNARREWRAVFAGLAHGQRSAAARLAQRHGWLDQAIMAANAADLTDDLDLRFPQVYGNLYQRASQATNIPVSTLLAMTRQESAFQHRARSSADARGLMQLLPSTARLTARRLGLQRPTVQQLYEPAINIRIASEYLSRLLARYNQQRPLAFAAYNAGEGRVDRWIKERSGMPMAVWIENIPFQETRGYVKSVLAFNHLYSIRMNEPQPLLLPHELAVN